MKTQGNHDKGRESPVTICSGLERDNHLLFKTFKCMSGYKSALANLLDDLGRLMTIVIVYFQSLGSILLLVIDVSNI